MKIRENFFGRFLVLLLAIFSLGGNHLFAGTLPEIREDHSPSEETIIAAHIYLWATRENPAPEFSEASEYHFVGDFNEKEHLTFLKLISFNVDLPFDYTRDIRRSITNLIFPTHFFL
ncbi:hypothetical protein SAMN04488034_101359 [Salinimicrobium catena]|uniref:Uncharacterized protein n=1 Tax=Salinimicrobium catena TaxID=390640 RepID=A0A1H5I8G4_9FLAO|nr:hypothetical protein [Salinimicrobium catena]SDK75670.1 hypothetical protein SAMN04488140_101359 [Salinimicrobium catena]SEE36507.1 hypothetical protein SAMN04488034_101359 [Salinimicrobium catena]